jgi:hypothetical protein
MPKNIKVTMKDGTTHECKYQGRPGGSYSPSIKYEGVFAIVTDEWGTATSLPASDIKEIKITELGGRF